MRRLTKNYWRTGWILFVNGAVIVLFLAAPIRQHHAEAPLYRALEMTPPPVSYFHLLLSEPWVLGLLAVLLLGVVAELRRAVIATIFNVIPYLVGLISVLSAMLKPGEAEPEGFAIGILLTIVLTVIVTIDAIFYLAAFKRMRADVRRI